MQSIPGPLNDKVRPAFLAGWVFVLAIGVMGSPSPSFAQIPPPPPVPVEEKPRPVEPPAAAETQLPPLAESPFGARPQSGLSPIRTDPPRPVAPFIAGLRANDAKFEVVVGQGRILTTEKNITAGPGQPLIAVGDPAIIEFAVLTNQQIRVTGLRLGVTDLSIMAADGQSYSFEVRVVLDLDPLKARLKEQFPDANLRLAQLRNDVVVEGQARDAFQITNIIQMIEGYLRSVAVAQDRVIRPRALVGGASPLVNINNPPGTTNPAPANTPGPPGTTNPPPANPSTDRMTFLQGSGPLDVTGASVAGRVINLIRLPGSQQVLLKVRVAELNRSAMRQIGANFLGIDPKNGAIVGSQIAGTVSASGAVSTVFGIFQDNNFEFTLNALRQNSMLKILAEPNLVALHGHQASFLAGGEFPVPVASAGAGGSVPTVNVQFKKFGVSLNFLPFILDGDVIRLSVAPEVSQIDQTIAVTLVAGGSPVPGTSTRQAQTTVEMREGQTLAIAGLMQLELNGSTDRIPGLGDLPIIGPFFSNTTNQRIEKELVVLVTPYLIEAMNKEQVSSTPGDEVKGPNDLEFFLLNRIEGRTGRDFRATTSWDDPMNLTRLLKLVPKYVNGPSGFSN
jgi:pilus assembly protein CpaC